MGRRVRSRGSMGSTVEHLSESGNAVPLAPGACYLIKEKKPDLSYRLFSMLTRDGTPGLIVTRQHPERVRQGRGIEGGRIVWLSHTPGEDYHNPTGIEYLVINNGFLQTLMFVEHVNEFVMQRKAIVIIPVSPDALEEKELALLERNIEVLESPLVKMDLETREVSKLLEKY